MTRKLMMLAVAAAATFVAWADPPQFPDYSAVTAVNLGTGAGRTFSDQGMSFRVTDTVHAYPQGTVLVQLTAPDQQALISWKGSGASGNLVVKEFRGDPRNGAYSCGNSKLSVSTNLKSFAFPFNSESVANGETTVWLLFSWEPSTWSYGVFYSNIITFGIGKTEESASSVTLTFDPNGGSVSPTSKTYPTSGCYLDHGGFPTPTKAGYTFDGWYTATYGGEEMGELWRIQPDVTIAYAHWSLAGAQKNKISFTANGGSCYVVYRYFTVGDCYGKNGSLPVPTWKNHTFLGWYSDASLETFVWDDSTVAADVTELYAKWQSDDEQKVTVTFNSNGGSSCSAQQYTVGGTYGSLPSPTKAGYTFDGWYTTSSLATKVMASSMVSSSITTLYAKWTANTYTVTLDRQSGSGGTSSVNATYGSAMPSITVPSRSGYTFGGYYTSTGGSGTQYYTASGASARTWDKTSATTLYAKWTANTQYVTVTFNSNGGSSCSAQQYTVGGTYGTLPSPTKTGYTFGGWHTTSAFTTKVTATSTVSSSVTTLYAKWTANTYTVTLDRQSGSGGTSSVNAAYGSAMPSITVPSRSGYTFGGYYTSTGGSGTQYYTASGASARTWDRTNATTLYAKWTAAGGVPEFTVNSIGQLTDVKLNGCTEIIIPSTVKTIPHQIFDNSSGLTRVTIPDSVTSIWAGPFLGFNGYCDLIEVVVSEDNLSYKSVSGLLLSKDGTLLVQGVNGNVTIPDGVTSIGSYAFSKCKGLTSVVIPKSVTHIGSFAFSGCSGLTSISIPDGVTSIGDYAFEDCSGLSRITIPTGVKSIGERTFSGCSGLTSVTIPNSVTSIGDWAFSKCSGLTSLAIPASVTSIGDAAFFGCTGLADANGFVIFDNVLYSYCGDRDDVAIPDGVLSIGSFAFYNCGGLTGVHILNSVTNIGNAAFSGCRGLANIAIPASVTGIGSSAFYKCSGLTSVTIPASVTSIGYDAFYGCSGLTSIAIPDSVTSIGSGAFKYCGNGLYDKTSFPGLILVDGWCIGYNDDINSDLDLTGIRGVSAYCFSSCKTIEHVKIPEGIESLDHAFNGCSNLRSVELPYSMKRLTSVFDSYCAKLAEIHVPSLKTWCQIDRCLGVYGSYTYYREISFPSQLCKLYVGDAPIEGLIVIPDDVEYIADFAFYGYESITSLVVPSGVARIGASAFRYCDNLKTVFVSGNPEIPNSSVSYQRNSCPFEMKSNPLIAGNSLFAPEMYFTDKYGQDFYGGRCGLALSPSGEAVLPTSTKLSASCAIDGAEMRYTTDGTMPTMESPIFKSFTVKDAMTVTVGAFLEGERVLTTQGTYWFGEVATPKISIDGNLTFIGNQARMVTLSCDTENAVIHYTVYGEEPTENSPVYVGPFAVNLSPDETLTIRARAFKTNCKPSEIAETSLSREWALGDGVNAPGLVFTAADDAGWGRETSNGHGDNESLKSGAISDGQSTWIETAVNGKGTVSFWWKTSCEETDDVDNPWDRAEFSIDGVRVAWMDGERDWQRVEQTIAEDGEHVLRWTYVKDANSAEGLDCMWLDDVAWDPMAKHIVTFDADGGDGGWSKFLYEGSAIIAPAVRKKGFRFIGWEPEIDETVPDKDVCYVAQWETALCVITLDSGSAEVETLDVTDGWAIGELPSPTRNGAVFLGWYTATSGGEKVTAETIVSGDMTVYAQWAAAWTVTLNANGGALADGTKVMVQKGKAVGTLPVPVRDGYAFAGWFAKKSGGTKVTAKTKITKNVTYYAHWTAKKYAVTLLREGKGSVSGGGKKAYQSKVTVKAKPSKGYVFQGWWKMDVPDATGRVPPVSQKATYSFKVPLGGVTYKAKFITKAEDTAAIGMEFGGVGFGSLDDGGGQGRPALPVITNTCGVVTTWPIATTGATPVSVSVKGQPKGMSYDAKKKVVTGVPSVANKSGTMTITVKSSGGSRAWTVQWRTVALDAFACGSFNGWTYEPVEGGEGGGQGLPALPVRKVTVSVTGAGKITAKVGTLSLARTGWTVGEDGLYRATLSKVRTVGTGKKVKKYKDVLTLVLDPEKGWTEDQLAGSVATYLTTDLNTPINADTAVSARRNPFGDKNNAEAKDVAAQLAALGTQSYVDETGLAWKLKVSVSGVATISRTTGTGKKKKTVNATAVIEVDAVDVSDPDAGYTATARFLVGGKVIVAKW